jgi:hypothetical protein
MDILYKDFIVFFSTNRTVMYVPFVGDTITRIARIFDANLARIRTANDLARNENLEHGKTLFVPDFRQCVCKGPDDLKTRLEFEWKKGAASCKTSTVDKRNDQKLFKTLIHIQFLGRRVVI